MLMDGIEYPVVVRKESDHPNQIFIKNIPPELKEKMIPKNKTDNE